MSETYEIYTPNGLILDVEKTNKILLYDGGAKCKGYFKKNM